MDERFERMKTIGLLLMTLTWLALPASVLAFYNPEEGRWLNRDPLTEPGFKLPNRKPRSGGLYSGGGRGGELYVFVGNNPLSQIDAYGLQSTGAGTRPDYSCCDKDTTDKAKQELVDRYNAARDYLEDMGAPHNGSPAGPTACLSYALYIHKFLRPLPNCWTCWVECRREKMSPFHDTWDENAVVCESHPSSGAAEKIIFDYFANRPAAENYDGWYKKEHPILKDEGTKTWDTDCQGKCKPQSARRPYDWTILDSLLDELEKEKKSSSTTNELRSAI